MAGGAPKKLTGRLALEWRGEGEALAPGQQKSLDLRELASEPVDWDSDPGAWAGKSLNDLRAGGRGVACFYSFALVGAVECAASDGRFAPAAAAAGAAAEPLRIEAVFEGPGPAVTATFPLAVGACARRAPCSAALAQVEALAPLAKLTFVVEPPRALEVESIVVSLVVSAAGADEKGRPSWPLVFPRCVNREKAPPPLAPTRGSFRVPPLDAAGPPAAPGGPTAEPPPAPPEEQQLSPDLEGLGGRSHLAHLTRALQHISAVFDAPGSLESKMKAVRDLLSRFERCSLGIGPTLVIPALPALSLTRYYALADGNYLLQLNAQGYAGRWRSFGTIARMVATSRDRITPEDHSVRFDTPALSFSFGDGR